MTLKPGARFCATIGIETVTIEILRISVEVYPTWIETSITVRYAKTTGPNDVVFTYEQTGTALTLAKELRFYQYRTME